MIQPASTSQLFDTMSIESAPYSSWPLPQKSQSRVGLSPPRATRTSLPSPPYMTSAPEYPYRKSLPDPPLRTSLPPLPRRLSALLVPLKVSGPLVPILVTATATPWQRLASRPSPQVLTPC